MTNDIVKHEAVDVNELQAISRLLAMSGYFDAKGNSETAIAQIATKVLAGREMGFGPFASVQGIYLIQGRPSVSANLIASAIKGHPAYDYRVRELSEKVCTIEFFQVGNGKRELLGVSTFTADDARRAGTKNMDKFARNMLFARCISNGHRWYCPDVFNGNAVYVPEELGADVDGDGNVISEQPKPQPQPEPQKQLQQGGGVVMVSPGVNVRVANPTEPWLSWQTPEDAFRWAIEVTACVNVFEAQNSLKKIVDRSYGGHLTKKNMADALCAFYERQLEKLGESLADEAGDDEDNPWTEPDTEHE